AREITRVLKPGGRMAVSVWNVPEKNFWLTAILAAINKNMGLPVPVAGSPGMFSCAVEDFIIGLFRQAGLKNISVTEVKGKLPCRTINIYWNIMTEITTPVVALLSQAGDSMRKNIRRDVYQAMNERYTNGNVVIGSSALVIYGEK
ncbi:MAG TPA: hypothetical protein VK489_15285, partial [Ferruginibacter sp.]|nr:hypothetical protein [Ferruginibacter sp.]